MTPYEKIAAVGLYEALEMYGLEKFATHPAFRLAQRALIKMPEAERYWRDIDESFRSKWGRQPLPFYMPAKHQTETMGNFQFRPVEGRRPTENVLRTFLPHPRDVGQNPPSGSNLERYGWKIPDLPVDPQVYEDLRTGRLTREQILKKLGLGASEPPSGTAAFTAPGVFRRRG